MAGRSTLHALLPIAVRRAPLLAGFGPWLRAHRGANALAGVLAFFLVSHFFVGAWAVMHAPAPGVVAVWAGWCLLFGALLWCSLLTVGYLLLWLDLPAGPGRRLAVFAGAGLAAGCADLGTAGRSAVLVAQGVVPGVAAMLLNAFLFCFVTALLYFTHLQHSRAREEAASRLAAAQDAQRRATSRLAQARLQTLQARVDPALLFDMLEAVRRCYEHDAARAERLFDGLTGFLRTLLLRLHEPSSSLAREAELAQTYVKLRALAGAKALVLALRIEPGTLGARFPPGVLLPLLADATRGNTGRCELAAARRAEACRLVLCLPLRPADAAVAAARQALAQVYGGDARLSVDADGAGAIILVEFPYEAA